MGFARLGEQTGRSYFNDFGNSPYLSRHGRQSRRHSLHQRERHSFSRRAADKQLERVIDRRHVGLKPRKMDAISKTLDR